MCTTCACTCACTCAACVSRGTLWPLSCSRARVRDLRHLPSSERVLKIAEWPYVADVRVTFYSLLLSGYARHTIGADNFGRYLNYTLINTLLYIFQSTCRSLRMRRENPSLGFREPRVQRALYPIRKGALQTARRGGRARSRGSAPRKQKVRLGCRLQVSWEFRNGAA